MKENVFNMETADRIKQPPWYVYAHPDGEILEAQKILKSWMDGDGYKWFLRGTALMYLLREPFKGEAKDDVRKAITYLEILKGEL